MQVQKKHLRSWLRGVRSVEPVEPGSGYGHEHYENSLGFVEGFDLVGSIEWGEGFDRLAFGVRSNQSNPPGYGHGITSRSFEFQNFSVFWCSLNNPVVLKFFWRHLAEKNAKNSKNLFHGLTQIFDNNFKTAKDNLTLKQSWTIYRGIVSLYFWRVSFWTIQRQLRSICPIGWENLYFCQISTFFC